MMSPVVVMILLIMSTMYPIHSQWIAASNPATFTSFANDRMAMGYYEDSILILGGFWTFNSLIEYNINDNDFTDLTALSDDVYGQGKYWSQSLDILYILNPNDASIMIYDLSTKTMDPSPNSIGNLPQDDSLSGCIASTPETLYVIAGCCTSSILYIFSFDDPGWITGPTLDTPRREPSCILSSDIQDSNQRLYVIGGWYNDGDTVHVDSVEVISTFRTIFDNKQWSKLSTTLSEGLSSTGVVLFNDIIYVIGGIAVGTGSGGISDKMHLIDINTNVVSLSSSRLAVGVWGAGVILVDNTIYAFGGSDANGRTATWQTYQMYV